MKMYILPTLISILLIFSTTVFAQTVSVLPAIKDNSMFNESGTKSLGAGKLFAGQTCQGNIRRALIQFDLSAIPSDAMVTNVELKLGAEKSRGMGDGIIDVFAVTQEWGEGTSDASGEGGNGATAISPDATWTDAMLGTATWSTPGGDFDPTLLTSRVTTEEFQTISFPSSENFATQVETWSANPSSNFGILIIGVEGTDCSTYRFGARDDGTAPELVVTWESICEPDSTTIFAQTCDEYITGTGTVLNTTGTYTEGLVDMNGCDSIIIIELTVLESSELIIDGTLCQGQTFTLEGIVFDENNPSGEIILQAVNGCDSIVMIDLEFELNSTTFINETLCFGERILVNGTFYDELNPMGCETLSSENGCDSIICVDLTFFPQSMSTETYTGCEGDGYTVVVNGTTYSELNPNGVELLEAVDVNGCDSIVVIEMVFEPSINVQENYTGCQGDGYSITVDGIIFDENNPEGIQTLIRTNGCDSIVTVDLFFATPPSAGTATGPIDICNDSQLLIDLGTLLTGADPGGDWTETSTTPSTGFAGNQFDGNGQIPATYIFRYTVSSINCGDVFTEVMITVEAPITAEVLPAVTVCNNNENGNSSIVNFNNQIIDGSTNGIWTDKDGVGVDLTDLSNVDFTGIPASTSFTFCYTTSANGGCPAQVYMTEVFIEDCICPSVTTNENYSGCEGDGYEVIVNGIPFNEFNPSGTEILTSLLTGCDSIVIVDLDFNSIGTSEVSFGTCDVSIPPFFSETIENGSFNGCDSVINFSTIYFPTDSTIIFATTCDPEAGGTEVIILPNTNGCDSVITTITSVLPSDEIEVIEFSCDPSDTTTVVLNLINQYGCDSIVTISTFFESLENGVTVDGNTITALLAGAEYEWIECDTAFVIQDANEQSFTAPVTGNYAVVITQDGCTVTSECKFIDLVSTEDAWFKDQISISPNPTSGDFQLNFGDLENINIRIVDLTGKILEAKQNLSGGSEELRIEGPAGVYFVEVELEGVRTWMKVVVL